MEEEFEKKFVCNICGRKNNEVRNKNIVVRVSDSEFNEIKVMAKKMNTDISGVIRIAIKAQLERLEADKNKKTNLLARKRQANAFVLETINDCCDYKKKEASNNWDEYTIG